MNKFEADRMRRIEKITRFGSNIKAWITYLTGQHQADFSGGKSAFLLPLHVIEGGEKMRRLNKKGQSTLEYVIIWTAIVAAILLAANQFLRPAIEGAVQDTSDKITTEVGNLTGGIGN